MKIKILGIITAIIIFFVWFSPFQTNMENEIIFTGISIPTFWVDGFTPSATIVTWTATFFSVMSWILLAWADHRKSILRNSITSALLGLIVITPISGIAGPMLAVILGISIGSSLFAFEFWRKKK